MESMGTKVSANEDHISVEACVQGQTTMNKQLFYIYGGFGGTVTTRHRADICIQGKH